MPRSLWKSPFVEPSLLKIFSNVAQSGKKTIVKTRSRKSTIIPAFVGMVFGVYNGKKFIPLVITEEMVGHKLGEFSPTRTYYGHNFDNKKAKKDKK